MNQHEQDFKQIRFVIRNNGDELLRNSNSQYKDAKEMHALIETILCNYESGVEDEGITGFTTNIVRNAHDLQIGLRESHTHFVGIYADQLGITDLEEAAMEITEPILWEKIYGFKYNREI